MIKKSDHKVENKEKQNLEFNYLQWVNATLIISSLPVSRRAMIARPVNFSVTRKCFEHSSPSGLKLIYDVVSIRKLSNNHLISSFI